MVYVRHSLLRPALSFSLAALPLACVAGPSDSQNSQGIAVADEGDEAGAEASASEGSIEPDLSNDEGSGDEGELEGSGGDGHAEGGETECPQQKLDFQPQIPTVVMLLDQSGSMNARFDDTDRWGAVGRALFNDTDGIVKQLEDEVRFGVALYTSVDGNAGGECPMLVEAEPSLGNHATLRDLYAGQTFIDETPTGESLSLVSQKLADFDEPGQKIIVLATDGEPDTCDEPNPQNGQPEALAAAAASHAAGIDVYAISVGTDIGEQHLAELAEAGVGQPGAPYYVVTDTQALVEAFREIIDGVRSCVLELEVELKLNKAHLGTVKINGVEVDFDSPDGWQANSKTQIELVGASCEAIQSGEVEVDIEFPCDTFDPPAR